MGSNPPAMSRCLDCKRSRSLCKTCSVCPAGQGANQALEDAAELGWAVQQHGPTAEALRAYEMERLERVRTIVGTEQVETGWCSASCAHLSSSGHRCCSPLTGKCILWLCLALHQRVQGVGTLAAPPG